MHDAVKEYGGALFALAEEENLLEDILRDTEVLVDIFRQNPDYVRLLSAPHIPKGERLAVVREAFACRVHEYTLNFLLMMTELGYAAYLVDCFAEYKRLWRQREGLVEAEVISAAALTDGQLVQLSARLEKLSGKRVEMHCRVDASLIGGMQVRMDGKLLEGSVRARLDGLRDSLSKTVL